MVNATVEALRKRQQQIAARLAAIASSEKAKARKEDTRLKVLVGAAILADVARHPEMRAGVLAVLQRAITADRDREFLKDIRMALNAAWGRSSSFHRSRPCSPRSFSRAR